jgi:hypothetical protein
MEKTIIGTATVTKRPSPAPPGGTLPAQPANHLPPHLHPYAPCTSVQCLFAPPCTSVQYLSQPPPFPAQKPTTCTHMQYTN